MDEIARLIHAVVAGGKDVKAEVNRFRARFQAVSYSFDAPRTDAKAATVEMDIAGY